MTDTLLHIGRQLRRARGRTDATTDAARAATIDAYAAGYAEQHIANTLGINRSTVRAWLGK